MQRLDDSAEQRPDGAGGSRAAAPTSGRHVAVLGHFRAPSGYAVHRPDGGRSWLAAWTIDGVGRFTHAATTVTAGPRSLVVAAPDRAVAQSYATVDAPWHFWWMHFRMRPTWSPLVTHWTVGDGLMVTTLDDGTAADRVTAAFGRARDDVVGTARKSADRPDAIWVSSESSTDLVLNALDEVLLVAAAHSPTAGDGATADVGLDAARRRISTDPAAPHSVASLAAVAAMSPSHFAHRFTERFGHSPMVAVREERLDLAAALLRGSGLAVNEVARAVGYSDPFYFTRLFRRYRGTTPSRYAVASPEINNS